MLRATLKSLLAHRVRLLLSACATALGVAFVAGTLIFTATVQHGLTRLFDTASAGTDVVVRHGAAAANPAGGGDSRRPPVPATLLDRVRSVPSVAVADGAVTDRAGIVGRDGRVLNGRSGVAASWPADPALAGAYKLRQGRPPAGPGEVAVDAATARAQGLHVGDRIRVVSAGAARPYTISGITGFGDSDGPGAFSLAVFDTATAQHLFGKQGRFDEIDVKAVAGVAAGTLRDRVAAVLPGGTEAVTAASAAAAQAEQLRQALGSPLGPARRWSAWRSARWPPRGWAHCSAPPASTCQPTTCNCTRAPRRSRWGSASPSPWWRRSLPRAGPPGSPRWPRCARRPPRRRRSRRGGSRPA